MRKSLSRQLSIKITDKAIAATVNINITGIVIFDKTSIIIVVFALAINNGNAINRNRNMSFDLSYPNLYCTGI